MKLKTKELLHELKHHSPFTAIATVVGLMIAVLVIYFIKVNIDEKTFELFHFGHIFVSSIVTAAIFYKYKKNFFQALLVGSVSSMIIGSVSDILFPYLGGTLLNLKVSFHLPIVEIPLTIIGISLLGSVFGTVTKLTKIPHFIHVFLSVFASLFYLLAFSPSFNPLYLIATFFIVFIAVIIPCCISDIISPFLFLGERIKHCNCK
ncbi:MAG: hypothetical protein KKB31_06635 [Nanoarchaeota archaeon]|nr:hypothetical protein [Nanoarchaeota archaeon]